MEKIINNIKRKSVQHTGSRGGPRQWLIRSHKNNQSTATTNTTTTVPRITMTLDDDDDMDVEVNSNGDVTRTISTVDPATAVPSLVEVASSSNVVVQQQQQQQHQSHLNNNKIIGINHCGNLSQNNNMMTVSDRYRKQSTGTLNRLILVAQALESEVDSRRRSDVNGSRIVSVIRVANMIFLILVNVLILTGVGQYHGRNDVRLSLLLTMDKWYFRHGADLPPTFAEMRLSGQYLAQTLSALMFIATLVLQFLHCCSVQHSKLMCICYSFGCVPFSLLVFGLEMHYSACPWLDDFYRTEVLRRDFHAVEKYFDTQCGINGWALAGIFSLLSCGLFVSEGLITAFFHSGYSHNDGEKTETIL